MKTYTEYKTFEYNWHPDIPKHWDELFLQQVCKSKCDKNIGNKIGTVLSLSYGKIIQKKDINSGLSPKDFSTYQIVEPEDIILRLTDLQNDHRSLRTGLVRHKGIITAAYTCIKPSCNASYLHYLLHSYDLRKVFYGMGGGVRQSIGFDDIRHMHVPVPPRAEQDQIVRFLDWKVSQIDRLIAGYQKEIALLKERRTTIIDRAVTKGIDPEARMQHIDANWMGDIPAHWEMIPAKRLFSEGKMKRLPGDPLATASQKYGIITQSEYMEREGKRIVVANQGIDDWKHVEPDNFVISLRSFQGGLERSEITCCVTWHYIVLLPQRHVKPRYFKWLFKSVSYIKALQGTSDFIRDGQDLRYSNFEKVDLPLISLEEQSAIADYIDKKTAEIDDAIPRIDHQISLLREYRTRLICDVVTGQIDVRDVVIPEDAAAGDTPVFCNDTDEGEVGMDADEY